MCDCWPRFAWHDFEVVLMSGRRSAYIVVKVKVNFTRGRGVTMTLFDRPVAVMSLPRGNVQGVKGIWILDF